MSVGDVGLARAAVVAARGQRQPARVRARQAAQRVVCHDTPFIYLLIALSIQNDTLAVTDDSHRLLTDFKRNEKSDRIINSIVRYQIIANVQI